MREFRPQSSTDMTRSDSSPIFRFGDFELDVPNFTLRRGMIHIKLERIPMEALILLASQPRSRR